jgi:hypothetical protein
VLPRGFKKSLAATFRKLRSLPPRLTRRTAPSLIGLEERVMLSVKGVDAPILESIRPEAIVGAVHSPEAARVDNPVKFVDSLYKKYYHGGPDAAESSYALRQLASGVSRNALAADFKAVTSRTGKGITDQNFVTALYATIAGESPTSVGLAYWQGLLASGDSRSQVERLFSTVDGFLPAPEITWAEPANITFGTPLGSAQLDATASVPGTFAYSPAQGTVLGAGAGQDLSVVFTPADTADYPIVTDVVTISVIPLPTPTPTPASTPTPAPTSTLTPTLGPWDPIAIFYGLGTRGPDGAGDA